MPFGIQKTSQSASAVPTGHVCIHPPETLIQKRMHAFSRTRAHVGPTLSECIFQRRIQGVNSRTPEVSHQLECQMYFVTLDTCRLQILPGFLHFGNVQGLKDMQSYLNFSI